MIHIWRPWIVQFLRPHTPLSIYIQNSSTPLILDVQFQTNPYSPSYSPNDNQSVKRKQFKEDYYMLSGPSFRSAVVFSINSLILSVAFLRLLFIYLKPHHLLFHGFKLMCVQLPKNTTKFLLFVIIHILSILILQSTCFICTTWKRKQTMEEQPRRAYEQNKNKTKLRHIQINHAFYFSIYPTNNVMVSLRDGFTAWSQS